MVALLEFEEVPDFAELYESTLAHSRHRGYSFYEAQHAFLREHGVVMFGGMLMFENDQEALAFKLKWC